MKRSIVILISLFCLFSCGEGRRFASSVDDIRSGFENVPDSIHTTVFWYWISDHLSKEGVVADLHSMADAGINRAFIGFIGLPPNEMPVAGDVKTFSDQWWDILRTALRTASDLNIEIGLFNCPGWSQSGGPWIDQSQTMRYLESVRYDVVGGKTIDMEIPAKDSLWQDVKVIAYPKQEARVIDRGNATFRVSGNRADYQIERLFDNDLNTDVVFSDTEPLRIDIKCDENFLVRSITLVPTEHVNDAKITLRYKNIIGNYVTITDFKVNRTNPALSVGFRPYAPIAISIEPITASELQIEIENPTLNSGFSQINISSLPVVDRYQEKSLAKMHQSMYYSFDNYLWPSVKDSLLNHNSYIHADRVLDITKNVSGGKLHWSAPKGNWTIARLGTLPTGVVNDPAMPWDTGYEVDKMNKEYIAYHFDRFVGEILNKIAPEDRKTWKVVIVDSYEKGGQNFTDDFISSFKDKYGYDPTPFLPVYDGVVVESQNISDRFLWDMRRMVADRLAYSYAATMREKAHQNGLTIWLENYGTWGFPGEFLQYGGQSDEISGEFWSEKVFGDIGNIEVRLAASAAHIYGKTKVSAESFTSAGAAFSRHPASIKKRGDRAFTEGVNNMLLHLFISQDKSDGKPGLNAPFGTEFDRKNTLFSHMDLFVTYIKRMNFMLQQGINVADVAYFIGEDAPKMIGEQNPSLPRGYQFDYINAEVLQTRASVKDGLLTLPNDVQYKILVLPELSTMRPAVLKKIKQLVNDGLVVLGPRPVRSPSYQDYPEADKQVQRLADELWNDVDGRSVTSRAYGKGMILSGMDMTQALNLVGCTPDFECADSAVLYSHRSQENMEIYLISNQSDRHINSTASFRVDDKMKNAELWYPTSGETKALSVVSPDEIGIKIPLDLYPGESLFVVFHKGNHNIIGGERAASGSLLHPVQTVEISAPWSVAFESDAVKRGPQEVVTMDKLADLSCSNDDRIKHYSGKITYKTTVNVPDSFVAEDTEIYLDLGKVYNMAKVMVNGKYAGGLWTEPYRTRVTSLLTTGENTVEIEVVNTWVNRIIGDMNLPEKERQAIPMNNPWSANSTLQNAGLVGPVTLQVY